MTPFLQFRTWVRRAGGAEKAVAGLVAVVAVGLLTWSLVPGSSPSGTSLSTATGPAAGGARSGAGPSAPGNGAGTGAGTPGGTTPTGSAAVAPAETGQGAGAAGNGAPGSGAATARSGGSATPAGSSGQTACGAAGATEHGVTASEVHIGVSLPAIAGQAGNGLFGLPDPQTEQTYFQAAINWVNKNGGIQCRKLTATYYQGNPLDSNEEHSLCLQVVQDNPFAVIDTNFAYVAADKDCLAQAKIPEYDSSAILVSEGKQYYPYLFSYYGMWDRIALDFTLGAKQLGWFNGAHKVGVLEEDCYPEMNSEMSADLTRAGIPPGEVTTFSYGCPSGLIPPNEQEQAVLQFKTSGVDHVIDNVGGGGAVNDFSKDAQQQDFHPKYAFPDGGAVATFQSAEFEPDKTNFNGALAITTTQYGADHSHLPETSGTRTCDQIMATIGAPPTEQTPDAYGGVACALVTLFSSDASHTTPLTRTNLIGGLDQVGHLDFSFPAGPANFNTPGVFTGGQYWRQVIFDGSCGCFKVPDPTFKPNF